MIKFLVLPISLLLASMGWWKPVDNTAHLKNAVVCHPLADDMVNFASDPAFQALHPIPVSIKWNATGSMISYPTADGKTASAYLVKAKKSSSKWLFVYQEWWGLNDQIKQEADRLYADLGEKVNVLAIDMYDGKVTNDPKMAGQYMQGTDPARLETIVKGAYTYAGKKAQVANIGWCFGGSWSLRSALIGNKQNIGSVIYYGMPVKDVELLKTLNSDVLGLFATEQYISKEIIEQFAADMKAAGKSLDYKIFDAVHGFANPSNPKHDAAKTKEANAMALTYLRKKFGV
ncbi:MAG: dienelactone hydrolase family protein [Flavipsychrobacter sp.]|jgi:carboxymethylenebutenolidase|nr:dienelactone hydrolase family protein [Flavipsychrobacter sp.]